MSTIENFRSSTFIQTEPATHLSSSKLNTVEPKITTLFNKCSTLLRFCVESFLTNTSILLSRIDRYLGNLATSFVNIKEQVTSSISTIFQLMLSTSAAVSKSKQI